MSCDKGKAMKNILWVSDEPGWAYDANAKALASHMPQYKHHFRYTSQVGPESVEAVRSLMDIIVAMNPAGFYMYGDNFSKVVSILDTVRALGDSNEARFAEVAGIICNNEFLLSYANDRNDNVMLQPNGVDLEYFKPCEEVIDRKLTVGFAGNIQSHYRHYKGFDVYQEAANVMDIDQINILYGTESRLAPDRMVPDFYHKIDCLILASENEGCSNVITEALACGVPVVCTKVGYHGHALTDEEECLFVEKRASSILNTFLRLQEDRELLNHMKLKARLFAENYHNIKLVAVAYSMFFDEIIQ